MKNNLVENIDLVCSRFILNTPILTDYGQYKFFKISLEEAREWATHWIEFQSAVGHEATAGVLSKILNVQVPMNRIAVKMKAGDEALVFRLLDRLPEGKVLNEDELNQLSFEIAILKRIS